MFCISPIYDFSIPPYIQTCALSSSSFRPPYDPISPLALDIDEVDEGLTYVEAGDRQTDVGDTRGCDTFIDEK